MSDLYQMVYISYANAVFDVKRDLATILENARAFNPPLSLTGLLLYRNQVFLQLLEGPKASIDQVMGKIIRDRRHGNLSVITFQQASQRLYPNWSMAYHELGELDINFINRILKVHDIMIRYRQGEGVSNLEVLNLFERFKKDMDLKTGA